MPWFEKFISLKPNNFEGYYYLAKTLLILDDTIKPIELIRKAMEINPDLRFDIRKELGVLPISPLPETFYKKLEE